MPRFVFNKLVRNKIPEQLTSHGAKPDITHLNQDELKHHLIMKITEEAAELAAAPAAEIAAELADVQQALDDLRGLLGVTQREVDAAKRQKFEKSGGFSNGTYISANSVREDDPWVDYYRKHPDRYPEQPNRH